MTKNLLYSMGHVFVRLYARLMLKVDVHWHGALPVGPKLFVANHPSATDAFLIHLLSRQPLSVLITSNAFSVPIFGLYLRGTRQICVMPGQGSDVLEQARQALQTGRSVAIFPEGLISPRTGGYHPPRTGAARLALSTGVPVIPVGIYLPRERSYYIASSLNGKRTAAYWYLHGPYGMTVGQPMQFNGSLEDRDFVQHVSTRMMTAITELAEESERRVCRFELSQPRVPVV